MSNYLEAEVVTSEAQLQEEAVAKLQAELEAKGVTGYVPNPAALEIIALEVIAGMAQNAAVVASTVLNAIFTQFGVQLIGLAFNEGAYATAKTRWTIIPEAGVRHIPAGTTIEAGGKGYEVETETEVPSLATEVSLQVRAVERGTEYNGATSVAQQVNPISYVSEVQFTGETTGGVAEETAEEYRSRLVAALALQAPRPITATNFAEMTLLIPETYTGASSTPMNLVVGRATCIDGYSPTTIEIEGKTTTAKQDLKEVSTFVGVSVSKTGGAQSHPGSELHWHADGAGVYTTLARGTTMKAKLGASEGELSVNALLTAAKGKIDVVGKYEQERTVTVFVAKTTGNSAAENEYSSSIRTKIKEYLEERRELNFLIYVEPASYSEVRVTTKVKVLPGYTAASVAESVKAAIESYLSPGKWGNPTSAETGSTSWLNATQGANLVRYNQIIGVVEGTPGVQYVLSGATGLAIGLEEAVGSKVADLTLPGPAPLPYTVAANIKVETE